MIQNIFDTQLQAQTDAGCNRWINKKSINKLSTTELLTIFMWNCRSHKDLFEITVEQKKMIYYGKLADHFFNLLFSEFKLPK